MSTDGNPNGAAAHGTGGVISHMFESTATQSFHKFILVLIIGIDDDSGSRTHTRRKNSTPGQDTEPRDPALDDRISQPRGLGMKIFHATGEMFDEGKSFDTPDIEFNSTPALDLADSKTTKEIIDLRIKYGGNQKELYHHLEAQKHTLLKKTRGEVRNTHILLALLFIVK
ncbi:hypothetical protein BP6252_12117 [Coleophoma cylindrospora]|uniref:Uncharacterized protein n=1 Tax=Coleophoma cylindrospora TaxID=1849047 RepID=A0A3D8QH36_9HELO|nr:hypothetical protein BP6252_12117 [Coleophoma cylindrospora]